MQQTHSEYIPGYRFAVRIGGDSGKVCFSRISGIEGTLDYEEIYEGGYNAAPYLVAVPHRTHTPLVLEKGAAQGDCWVNKIRPGMKLGTWLEVILLDGSGKETDRTFSIQDGLVTRWEISGLDAMRNEILIERLEIMHEGIQYSSGAGRMVVG